MLEFDSLEQRLLFTANFQTIEPATTNNVAVAGEVAFAAAQDQGLLIVDLESLEVTQRIPPPPGTNTIDDVAVAADLLFALDAIRPGRLSVFSIENPLQPMLVSGPIAVDVGPFAGVSAANGRVVVSGGTGDLSVLSFDENGVLGEGIAQTDLGIGQPDVLISNAGDTAFVSTDFSGTVEAQPFGVTLIDISTAPNPISVLDRVGIPGAGFSLGVDGPANFPIESAQLGETLFVASGSGVSVFDLGDTQQLRLVDRIPLDTNPINVDVHEDHLFVVGREPTPTLTIIEIGDSTARIVDTFSLPAGGDPLSVAVTSDHIVIADLTLGVIVASTAEVIGSAIQPPALDTDIDGNSTVGFSDFLILSANFGRSVDVGQNGDIDRDGLVSFADFLLFAADFAD